MGQTKRLFMEIREKQSMEDFKKERIPDNLKEFISNEKKTKPGK